MAVALAEKIKKLRKAAGDPSYKRLARDIEAMGGTTISPAYLWQLETGKRDNPTLDHLQALARYFSHVCQVPVTLLYFDPQTPVDQPWRDARNPDQAAKLRRFGDEEEDLARRLADLGVERISARYGEYGTSMLRDVLTVAAELVSRAGPEPPDDSDSGQHPGGS